MTSSYAALAVNGEKSAGGLIGAMLSGGSVADAYATGAVAVNGGESTDAASGLAGGDTSLIEISNSYSTGAVAGNVTSTG